MERHPKLRSHLQGPSQIEHMLQSQLVSDEKGNHKADQDNKSSSEIDKDSTQKRNLRRNRKKQRTNKSSELLVSSSKSCLHDQDCPQGQACDSLHGCIDYDGWDPEYKSLLDDGRTKGYHFDTNTNTLCIVRKGPRQSHLDIGVRDRPTQTHTISYKTNHETSKTTIDKSKTIISNHESYASNSKSISNSYTTVNYFNTSHIEDCDDENACTIDTWNSDSQSCFHNPVQCPKEQECDIIVGCINPTKRCNDENPCTEDSWSFESHKCIYKEKKCLRGESCDIADGLCKQFLCSDDNACTIDTWNSALNLCFHEQVKCSQGKFCDTLIGCIDIAQQCDDNNLCTNDNWDVLSHQCVHIKVECQPGFHCNISSGICEQDTVRDCLF